jgi:sugar transferase (PEP-CTERM/EpsH1 system associated)
VRILFLSQRVPYPPNRGDKITTWRLVERMRRDHDVHCVAFAHDDADRAGARGLEAMGIPISAFDLSPKAARLRSLPLLLSSKPLTLGVFGSKALQREVDRLAPETDLAYAYSSSMGAFLLPHPELRRVMHFAELDSDKWHQYVARTKPPMRWVYAREWRTLLAFEHELAHAFEQNVFCTPLEQEIFRREIPGAPSVVLRNGVDLESFAPDPDAAEPGHVVFTGVMNYFPNADGCRWFADEILPRVRERVPDVHFSIVGAHPMPQVEALGRREGVTVTGFVDDTRDWLRRASVAVAPLRIARGIQNKVLEALAMGLPTVGTTCATQGTAGTDREHFLVEDEAEGFATAVADLLTDRERAGELAQAGRRFVEENYDWEVCLRVLDEVLAGGVTTPP